jgi:hypothetical protein
MINKGELLEVVAALHEYGLGGNTIAALTGFHASTIKYYLRELGLPPMTTTKRVEKILSSLPHELKNRATNLKVRSELLDAQYSGSHRAVDSVLRGSWCSDVTDVTNPAEEPVGGL